MSALAAVFALVVYQLFFSDGSLNNDEVAYLLQAEAMAEGRLFPSPTEPGDAHRIWFFVEGPAGLVPKYLPVVSAFFAASLALFGSVAPLLALQAAVLPWLVFGLAREVGLERFPAAGVAAVVSLSPLLLMESAVPLSYVLFTVLVTAAWWLCIRLGRGPTRRELALAAALGAIASAALAVRPYDTVLLLAAPLCWAAWRRRHHAWPAGLAAGLAALPLVAALAVYNQRATGSPLRTPFSLLEPADTVGFGVRRMFPEQTDLDFGPLHGVAGLVIHFGVGLTSWLLGGIILLPAAVAAWRRVAAPSRVLLAAVGLHLAGYALFWGPWNYSVLWGHGTRVLGPIYAVALVVPLAVAALPTATAWLVAWGRGGRVVAATAVVLAGAQLASALIHAHIDARRTDLLLDVADEARRHGPLLFDTDPPYLGHPVSRLVEGVTLARAAPVPAAGAEGFHLLQLPKAVYGPGTLSYALTAQYRAEAPELTVEVSIVERHADLLVVERAGRTSACSLSTDASREARSRRPSPDRQPRRQATTITIHRDGVDGCDGAGVPERWQRERAQRCRDANCVLFAVFREREGRRPSRVTLRSLPVETSDARVAMLLDGAVVSSSGYGWLRVSGAGADRSPIQRT